MRNWERPMAVVDAFVANEFVSACGDKNKVYKFKCDAGDDWGGYVYLETNGISGLQKRGGRGYKADQYLSSYVRCGATHDAKTTDDFLKGYFDPNGYGDIKEVIVWRGPKGDNTHCTTNLKMNEWDTAKS